MDRMIKHIDFKRNMRLVSILMLLAPTMIVAAMWFETKGLLQFRFPLEYGLLFSIICTLFLLWWFHNLAFRLSVFSRTVDAVSKSSKVFESIHNSVDLPVKEREVQELVSSVEMLIDGVNRSRKELEVSKSTLNTVLSHIPDIADNDVDSDTLIQSLLALVTDSCHGKASSILLINQFHEYVIHSKVGFEDIANERIIRHTRPFLQWIEKERKAIVMPRVTMKNDSFFTFPLTCVPLIHENHYIGALLLSGCQDDHDLNRDQLSLIANISAQIAYVFETARFKESVERVYIDTISNLALAVEERDPYLKGHSQRVQQYATKIGTALGLSNDRVAMIRDAARLHDIGRTGITETILAKNGPLTREERHVMQRHAAIGENIVIPLRMFRSLLDPIRHHHERLDGTGYPDGLKADDITLETRIVTVADIFDALLSDRPYRKGLVLGRARNELYSLAVNGKVDQNVVSCLFSLIDQGEFILPSAS